MYFFLFWILRKLCWLSLNSMTSYVYCYLKNVFKKRFGKRSWLTFPLSDYSNKLSLINTYKIGSDTHLDFLEFTKQIGVQIEEYKEFNIFGPLRMKVKKSRKILKCSLLNFFKFFYFEEELRIIIFGRFGIKLDWR